jgi:hypothetical protein
MINRTAGVFKHNKQVPRRLDPTSATQKGPPMYPLETHIPVLVDIIHALSNKNAANWLKAIRSKLTYLYNKGMFCKDNLPLGRNAIGNK